MQEGSAEELYDVRKRLSRSEAKHADLIKAVQDDLNDLSRHYGRHESEMVFPKTAAVLCAALALGFYLFGEEPAALPFAALAAMAIVIGVVKAQTMANIRHRIFEIEERLIARDHGVEWTNGRDTVATVTASPPKPIH